MQQSKEATASMDVEAIPFEPQTKPGSLPPKPLFEPLKAHEMSDGRVQFQKFAVKRKAVGIWGCKDCGKVKAGGTYTLNDVTVRSTIRRLREQTET